MKLQNFLESFPLEAGVGRGGADFGEQFVLLKGCGDGHRKNVLREHVERSGTEDLGVQFPVVDRVERCARLEIFEPVAGHDHALARLVEPVVGAADPLQQSRAALGRAHLDDEVDVAPVDAEVEAGGRHQTAQPSRRHRRLDPAPRFHGKAAVVDADGQRLVVFVPQLLKDQLGETARVAEDERRLVLLDQSHHVGDGVVARVPGPWDLAFGDQDREVRLGAGIADHEVDQLHVRVGREPGAVRVGVADGRRQTDAAQPGREFFQARHRQREQVAALFLGEAVQLVDDDRPQAFEHLRRLGVAEQQTSATRAWSRSICGGFIRCRVLRSDGVSPVRVSTRIGRPISSTGPMRLRWTSTASAFSGET